MNDKEKLKLDYQRTVQYFHETAGVRFKLLALVPVVTGATITLLGSSTPPSTLIPIGLLGFLATIGIMFYDQRNTQIYNAMQIRSKCLEVLLELPPLTNLVSLNEEKRKWRYGGSLLDRPSRDLFLFGKIQMWHDRGLAIIYSSALGAWSYLLTTGIVSGVEVGKAFSLSLRIGVPVVVTIVMFDQLRRFDKATDIIAALPEYIQGKLTGRNVGLRDQNDA